MPRILILIVLLFAAPLTGAQTLDKIRKSGTITLGFRPDAVPFSFIGQQEQKPSGFSIDLCERVVQGLMRTMKVPSLKVVWQPVTSADRIDQVTSGKVDLECGTTTVTLGRQARVDFSLITFLDGGAFIARDKGAAPRSPQEMRGARIGVSAGTTTEKALRKLIADNGSGAEVVTVANHVEGVTMLVDGKIAMYAADRTVLIGLLVNVGKVTPLQLLDFMFSYEPYALMMRRDPDFRLAVNRELAAVFREGEIKGIYNKWFGQFGPPQELLQALYVIQAFQE